MLRRGAGDAPWFGALVVVSLLLLFVTLLSYAWRGHGLLSAGLFWLGLSGENNIGAWWSSMLTALAAVMAFDGHFAVYKQDGERRGMLALGFALLLLSFAEMASLHEYLDRRNDGSLVVLGVVGLALAGYSLVHLQRAAISSSAFTLLLSGFGLLALLPFVESLHVARGQPVLYGVRVVLEEGIEIAAALIFIHALRDNSEYLSRASKALMFGPLVRQRRSITLAGIVLWPLLTAATFLLPTPGGPADWLAAVLLLVCALLAVRSAALSGRIDPQAQLLILFYVAASAASNAVRLDWGAVVLAAPVSVRGMIFAVLLVAAATILPMNGRRVNVLNCLLVAAIVIASSAVWPTSQLLWCGLPPLFALWLYGVESKAAVQQRSQAPVADAGGVLPLGDRPPAEVRQP